MKQHIWCDPAQLAFFLSLRSFGDDLFIPYLSSYFTQHPCIRVSPRSYPASMLSSPQPSSQSVILYSPTLPKRHSHPPLASNSNSLVVGLLAVVVLVLHEKVLVCAVAGEKDRRRAEAGKGAAEAVPAGKGALKSPGITAKLSVTLAACSKQYPSAVLPQSCASGSVLTLSPKGRSEAWCRPP